MALPSFYDAEKVGTSYLPQTAQVMAEGSRMALAPADDDKVQVLLLLVDPQVDFIHLDGSLAVPGAVADTRRTIEWIFRNLARISAIAASLDSHIPNQIFFPAWWLTASSQHPEPFTPIPSEEVEAGHWQPLFEQDWSLSYVRELEQNAKKQLMIWPYHTMIGSPGHLITPALYEAILFHASARRSQPRFLIKGMIPKTEFYSMLEPEIPVPDDPAGTLNQAFLEEIIGFDRVYIAGQAKSHCVLETLNSIMRRHGHEPEVVRKLHLLGDCTSSVQHPEIDFEALANDALERHRELGLRIIDSTDA